MLTVAKVISNSNLQKEKLLLFYLSVKTYLEKYCSAHISLFLTIFSELQNASTGHLSNFGVFTEIGSTNV